MAMHNPPHPGEFITEVYLEPNGLSGRELAARLAPMRPEMGVLYMSGYPDNTIVQHGVLEPGTAFLQKPFTINALELKVREVLDGTRQRGREVQTFEQISLFPK